MSPVKSFVDRRWPPRALAPTGPPLGKHTNPMVAKVNPLEGVPQTKNRWSDKEWEEIRRLGLCFRCKSDKHKSFQCPTLQKVKALVNAFNTYLESEDEEGEKEDGSKGESNESAYEEAKSDELEGNMEDDSDPPLDSVDCCATITSVATMGELIPKTLRIPIIVGKRILVALIDSGSTHNFINPNIAQECRLPISKVGHLKSGNGKWSKHSPCFRMQGYILHYGIT